MNTFIWLIGVEFKLLSRQGNMGLQPLLLVSLIAVLFPFSMSSTSTVYLNNFAPSIIWVAALLAVLMELNQLFYSDFKDGTLEQVILYQPSTISFIHAKIIAYWCRNGLVISLCSPFIALILGTEQNSSVLLFTSLSLGTLILTYLGGLISSLVLASRQSGFLTPLLALPFYIPTLIWGASLSSGSTTSVMASGALYFLSALLVFCIVICPIGIRHSLKYGVQ